MDLLVAAASLDRIGMTILRVGIVTVLVWIGGLKFAKYEADGIVPMVSNSPFMSFFYRFKSPAYRDYMNKEGELSLSHREWHAMNGTYPFSRGLGSVIVTIGVMIACYPIWPSVSAAGSMLLVCMCLVTLSFLGTTPEAWVQPLGDTNHGFPYLAVAGRLIIKDVIMLGGAVVVLSDAAKHCIR